MFFRQHNYAPLELLLVTVGRDDAAYGTLAVDVGLGRGAWREVIIDDNGGRRLRNGYASRYVPLVTATRTVTVGTQTSTVYALGSTDNRQVRATWPMPDLVTDLIWSAYVNNAIPFRGVIDGRGFPALKTWDLSGGRATAVGVPDSIQELYLGQRTVAPILFAAGDSWAKHNQTAYQLATGKGQGIAMGTLGLYTLGRHPDAGNGVLDLRHKAQMRRLWGTELGARQVLLHLEAPLEELVLAFNSLGRYNSVEPETGYAVPAEQQPFGPGNGFLNFLPRTALKLLAIGSSAVNSSNITGQVLAPGGLPMAAINLEPATQLRYFYAGGSRMVGNHMLPDGDMLLEYVAPLCDLTAITRNLSRNPTPFPSSLRYLAIGEANGFNSPAYGQTGNGIPHCNLTGAAGLKICIWSGAKTGQLTLPGTEGLLDIRLHANALTSIVKAAGSARTYLWPTTLLYLRLGHGQSSAPAYDNRLLGTSSSNTSYGQDTTVAKRPLDLRGCNSLIVVDGRQSNLNQLLPQANKASMVQLILSPIGTFRYTAGYLTITQANNNAFAAAGALDLTGYDSLSHVIANYSGLTNTALTLPGSPNGAFNSWAKSTQNPLLQLELAGNDLTQCPFAAGDYPNLSGLLLGGRPNVSDWTTRGANRILSIPRAHLTQLRSLGLEYQYQTGTMDYSAHPLLVYLNVERNGHGAAPGTATPALPPALTELYAGNQVPPVGTYTNRLDWSGSGVPSVDVIDAPAARLDYVNLPNKPVMVKVDLGTNLLTPASLVIPASFSMPAGSTFRVNDNPGLTDAWHVNTLAPLIGTRLLCSSWLLGQNTLTGATAAALVDRFFAMRAALAPVAGKTLQLKAASLAGTLASPAGYAPTMSEAAMTTAAASWSPKEKLWVLRFGRSATTASYNWSGFTTP